MNFIWLNISHWLCKYKHGVAVVALAIPSLKCLDLTCTSRSPSSSATSVIRFGTAIAFEATSFSTNRTSWFWSQGISLKSVVSKLQCAWVFYLQVTLQSIAPLFLFALSDSVYGKKGATERCPEFLGSLRATWQRRP